MDRRAPTAGRLLSGLDSDPAAADLRRRAAEATPGEIRALHGAWVGAVLRALWSPLGACRPHETERRPLLHAAHR